MRGVLTHAKSAVDEIKDDTDDERGVYLPIGTGGTSRFLQVSAPPDTMNTTAKTCELENCGNIAREPVEHPQRGRMTVCEVHGENIRRLPARLPMGAW